MPQPPEGHWGGQTELWCHICSARVQFVGVGVGLGRSARWEIFHPWVRLSGSHGSGKDLGQELVCVLGWKHRLSEPRVGFRDVPDKLCPGLCKSVPEFCGPPGATRELQGCEQGTLRPALKPCSSEKVLIPLTNTTQKSPFQASHPVKNKKPNQTQRQTAA